MAIKILPCKQCGATQITLWECGYSSFNQGGGRCRCGYEIGGEAGCSPTRDTLASIWNSGQTLTEVESLKIENKKLRAKVRKLQKLLRQ